MSHVTCSSPIKYKKFTIENFQFIPFLPLYKHITAISNNNLFCLHMARTCATSLGQLLQPCIFWFTGWENFLCLQSLWIKVSIDATVAIFITKIYPCAHQITEWSLRIGKTHKSNAFDWQITEKVDNFLRMLTLFVKSSSFPHFIKSR